MKISVILRAVLVLGIALGAAFAASAQSLGDAAATGSSPLSFGGAVFTDDRVTTKSDPQFSFQEYRLNLTADARPTGQATFHSEAWLRASGTSPNVTSPSDLFNLQNVVPLAVDLREAYFELKGFIFENIDLKIGRQRIAWGTADKLNPTDNVNPYDLQDPWDFGRHLGSDGVQLSVYAGGIQMTALAIPIFTPSVLPEGAWATALTPAGPSVPTGVTVGTVTSAVALPGSSLVDSVTAGLKVKGNLLGCDLSASYLYGRQSLPVIDNITVKMTGPTAANVTTELVYPREHIFGTDLAGSIFGIGVWAEAAVFLPQKVTLAQVTDMTALGGGTLSTDSTALENAPYVKYALGADYTFPGNIYLNVQYLHGFFHEAGQGALEDYFAVGLDWRLFDEKLTLSPLSGVIEVKNWSDLSRSTAILASPSLTIRPMDNAELVIGLHWIQGAVNSTFGKLNDNNEVYAQARYSF
jgi:hypothetical protein